MATTIPTIYQGPYATFSFLYSKAACIMVPFGWNEGRQASFWVMSA